MFFIFIPWRQEFIYKKMEGAPGKRRKKEKIGFETP